MRSLRHSRFLAGVAAGSLLTAAIFLTLDHGAVTAQERPFVGGVKVDSDAATIPMPIRNDVSQPGDGIVTLRHFRIKKGGFTAFYAASTEGVWPYFEKIGSRVVGMWKVIHPEDTGGAEDPAFDEVYLLTRYASVDHWRATRDMVSLGGNGPDWEKCRDALELRETLTLETSVTFLAGDVWHNPPQYLPGLNERYERVQ